MSDAKSTVAEAVKTLEEKFKKCVEYIQNVPSNAPYQASNQEKLQFYALFKQATEGPCKGKAPSRLNLIAKAKW
jgi:acyl-CoA-binding protein